MCLSCLFSAQIDYTHKPWSCLFRLILNPNSRRKLLALSPHIMLNSSLIPRINIRFSPRFNPPELQYGKTIL